MLTVGADSNAAAVTLKTIQLVHQEFGVNINLGASNVSFGLPDRHTINQAFLALAIGQGATCVITDPMKLTAPSGRPICCWAAIRTPSAGCPSSASIRRRPSKRCRC